MHHLIDHYLNEKRIEQLPTRDGFGKALVALAEKYEQIIGLTGDLCESTRMDAFAQKFPERFFDVGVAEQNMMGIAAGLALSGKIPFITSYATFSPGRNWDQLRVSVCYSQANVKVIGHHSGLSVGPDGATHQALEDIAMTRVLPNLVVLAPCDAHQAYQATLAAGEYTGPVYMRLTREKNPVFLPEDTHFEIGKAQHVVEGTDVTIIACGPVAYEALQAGDLLADEDIACDIVMSPSIKPLDQETILTSVKKTGAVVTVEEHQITGGLGGAVAEMLVEHFPTPMERVGVLDTFGESGDPAELLKKYKLDRYAIVAAVKRAIQRKG